MQLADQRDSVGAGEALRVDGSRYWASSAGIGALINLGSDWWTNLC